MCGIFGYVGKNNTAPQVVLEGLKLLEYRGYDSWGIATKIKNQPFGFAQGENSKIKNNFIVEKHVGKIGNVALSSQLSALSSSLAIGHTRWATHGGATVANAHPHLDCTKTVAVVHNGIVENFQELKKDLTSRGHKFLSETDTEVIAHLIEEYLKKEGFASSVRDAFNKLHGLNAIVVAYSPSSQIIAAKTGSPLVVGIGKGEFFIASDSAGIVKHTNKVLFLEDNQMVIIGLSANELKLIKLPKGEQIKPTIQKLNWIFEDSEKGKFKHFMLKEIYEQPKVLSKLTEDLRVIEDAAKIVNKAFGTYLIGCGTASYACLSGVYLFSKIAKKHVNFSVGSEFNYIEDYLTQKSLILAVSQSGESIDVVEPVVSAQKKKAKIIVMTNVLGSTLFRLADYKILLNAGPEKCVLGTKSYASMLANMILLIHAVVGRIREGLKIVRDSSDAVEKVLAKSNTIKKLADKIYKSSSIYIFGRGLSYPLALESALKIKESSYIHAEGFAGGELKHGVIALIEKNTPVIFFVPRDETKEAILSNAIEVKSRGAFVIGIGHENNSVFDFFFKVKDCGASSIIPHIVFSQLLAYFLTVKLGHDPDMPRNLAKSITVK